MRWDWEFCDCELVFRGESDVANLRSCGGRWVYCLPF
jgi:hypothetical protein